MPSFCKKQQIKFVFIYTKKAKIQPINASNDKVIWTSSNSNVATVTDGLVTAIYKGDAIITATTKEGNHTATCSVNVDYRNKWIGNWDFTTIDYVEYTLDYGGTYIIIDDTINFIGIVEKYEKDRLKIVFKPNATEPPIWNPNQSTFPTPVNGLIYSIINELDSLIYPNFNGESKYRFTGFFSSNEVNIFYSGSGPLGWAAYENHAIEWLPERLTFYCDDEAFFVLGGGLL